ncbi:MAG: hypothetical protein L0Y64_09195 [Myxococcaceae bacterium]|nr:hypothetical protein [Myxococcaceae bacterium]
MKKVLLSTLAACALASTACTSVEAASVSGTEVYVAGQEDAAVAVVQANAIGFSALFYLVEFVQSDLDTVVNKLLVSEAKAMGGSRVMLLDAGTTPRHGIFALTGIIVGFPLSQATGVVLR